MSLDGNQDSQPVPSAENLECAIQYALESALAEMAESRLESKNEEIRRVKSLPPGNQLKDTLPSLEQERDVLRQIASDPAAMGNIQVTMEPYDGVIGGIRSYAEEANGTKIYAADIPDANILSRIRVRFDAGRTSALEEEYKVTRDIMNSLLSQDKFLSLGQYLGSVLDQPRHDTLLLAEEPNIDGEEWKGEKDKWHANRLSVQIEISGTPPPGTSEISILFPVKVDYLRSIEHDENGLPDPAGLDNLSEKIIDMLKNADAPKRQI